MSTIRIDQIREIVVTNPQDKELLQYQLADGTWINSNEIPTKVSQLETQSTAVQADITSLTNDLNQLSVDVNQVSSDLTSLANDLDSEVADRLALDARVVVLENADTNQDLTQLQNDLQSEITARSNADTALSNRLNVLESDPTTKAYVDAGLLLKANLTYVNDEIARATAKENELQALIEAIEGVNDVQAFQTQVDKIESGLGATYTNNVYSPDLTAHFINTATSVQNAAKLLDTQVNLLHTSKANQSSLTDEIQARQTADTNLDNLIGDVEDKFDAIVIDLLEADVTAQNSITALDTRVTTLEQGADLEAAVQQLQQDIATKASSADLTALTTRVVTLENDHVTVMDFNDLSDAVDLKASIVDLSTETTAREQADAALDARITTIEESVPTDANLQALADRVTVTENDISTLETSLLGYTNTADLTLLLNAKATVVALQQESADRLSADNLLQTNIDSVNANLTLEITNRSSADDILQNNIDDVVADLLTEVDARALADQTLQNNIDTVSGNLVTETNARTNADLTLQGLIDNLSDDLSAEALTRQADDAGLQNQINSLVTDIADEVIARQTLADNVYTKTEVDNSLALKATIASLDAEIARAQLAEQGLQSSIDTIMTGSNVDLDTFGELIALINSIDTGNSDGLAAEITARIAGDQVLQSNIDVVSGNLVTANNNINGLDARLDTIEGAGAGSIAKSLQDAKDYSDAQLLTETNNRTSADQLIQANITQIESDISDLETLVSDEEAARILADQTITTELNTKASTASVTIISSDLTTLTNDVSAIELRVDSAETTLAIKANQDDLNFETQARVEGDTALQSDISDLQGDLALVQQDITSINTNLNDNIIDTVNGMLDNNLHSGVSVSLNNDEITITSLLRTVNGNSPTNGDVTLSTSDIAEGTNQYYTQERVRTSISVAGDLEYDQENGIISFTNPWVQTDDVLEFNGYVKIQGHLVEQFDMGSLSNDVEYTLDGGSVASISHTVTDLGTLHYRRLF
jgi:hypothetical protein